MYKTIQIKATEFNAVRVKADGSELIKTEGIEGFAKVWLALTNNKREYPQQILRIYNDYDNGVYVICDNDEANVANVEEYLTKLGLVVKEIEDIKVVQPEEVYYDEIETELIDW